MLGFWRRPQGTFALLQEDSGFSRGLQGTFASPDLPFQRRKVAGDVAVAVAGDVVRVVLFVWLRL